MASDSSPLSSHGLEPPAGGPAGVHAPLEGYSSYRGPDWTPERLAFHQNLEAFAERVGVIVALQSNGKISQESAYAEIRRIWNDLRDSKVHLLNRHPPGTT